jgi:hypothetical protein
VTDIQYISLEIQCPTCAAVEWHGCYAGTTWSYVCAGCDTENEVHQPRLLPAHMDQIRRGELPGVRVLTAARRKT